MSKAALVIMFLLAATIVVGQQPATADSVYVSPPGAGQDSIMVFSKVDREASFEGGTDGWLEYLERKARANVAMDQGLPRGGYRVVVQFIVDIAGTVSNVKPIAAAKVCTSCIEEAVRVIKKSGKWLPAMQNGSPVKSLKKVSITFRVE